MGPVPIEVVVFALALLALVSIRGTADRVREALENFRGGPPTPMHPSPVNDSALLRKGSRRLSAG